jgi:hypothetical protein
MANLLSTSITGTATTSDSVVIGGTFANNPYNSVSSTRLMFGGGTEPNNYSIGTSLNNFGGNYTKLDLRWHTGIRMGAQPGYGGIRFFSDETLATRIMSIGETDANIRIDNNLWIGGAGGWITDLLGAKQDASTAITTGNIASQSVSVARQLLSPNDATVVAADSAMPSAGHSFIHTLALGPSGNDGHTLGMSWANTTSSYGAQIFLDTDPNDIMAIRSRSSTGVWTSWKTVWHSGNLTNLNQLTNGPGYITSVGNITRLWAESHPTDYYVRANWTGSYWQLTSNHPSPVQVGYADNSAALSGLGVGSFLRDDGWNTNPGQDANTQEQMRVDFTYSNNAPYTGELIRFGSNGYSTQFNTAYGNSDNFAFRTRNGDNGTWNPWKAVIHSGNIASQSVSYADESEYSASTGTTDNIGGVQFKNTGSNFGTNADTIDSNGITYYNAGVSNFSGNATDGALYSQRYSTSWQHQIAGDYRSGMIAVRGRNNGTWTSWRTIIDSSTIGSQSVNYAASAGSAPNGSNANSFYDVTAGGGNGLRFWSSDQYKISMGVGSLYQYGPVTDYSIKTQMDAGSPGRGFTWGRFNIAPIASLNSTSGDFQVAGSFRAPIFYDSDNTGYSWNPNTSSAHRFSTPSGYLDIGPMNSSWCHFQTDRPRFYFGKSVTIDGDLKRYSDSALYIHSANFTTYAQEKENQRLSTSNAPTFADIYTNGWFRNNQVNEGVYNQATGTHFYSHSAEGWTVTGSGGTIQLQFRSNHQSTLRGYVYADTSNNIGFLNNVGSWSLRCDSSGNVTATGDVTAYSDARLKTDVNTIEGALEKVLQMRGVTYIRTDNNDTKEKVGVIAQEIQQVLPQVVQENTDGYLTVSYGNIVGVLIEAIKEQQAQIDELKAKLDGLTN